MRIVAGLLVLLALGCSGLTDEVDEEKMAELAAQARGLPPGAPRDDLVDVLRDTFVRERTDQISFAQQIQFEVAVEDALADGVIEAAEVVVVRSTAPWLSAPLPPDVDRAGREDLFEARVLLAGGAPPAPAPSPFRVPECRGIPDVVAGVPRSPSPMPDHIAEYVSVEAWFTVALRREATLAAAEAELRARAGDGSDGLRVVRDGQVEQTVLRRLDAGVVAFVGHWPEGHPTAAAGLVELADAVRCP